MKRTEASAKDLRVALSLSAHIGAVTLDNLLSHFDQDLAAVFAAPRAELLRVHGVGEAIARDIKAIDLNRVSTQIAAWRSKGVAILTPDEEEYPPPLRDLDSAPPVLFARGTLSAELWAKTVAIVGTRNPTKEARFMTLQLASKLARHGYTVVSGLALGIDTAAHTGALAEKGRTIAVLGSGVLNIYPETNRQLAERAQECGALLSELHPRWGANAQRLVARNRIISGLSRAVILVESQTDGGAMYTARFAREQGRPVYTFDLPVGGNQALIRGGAIALKPDDPLDFLLGRLLLANNSENGQ